MRNRRLVYRGPLASAAILTKMRHRLRPAAVQLLMFNPLHATIEEFAAEGYTHIECFCSRCRMIRLRPMTWLPKISMGLTLDQLAQRLRCAVVRSCRGAE